MAALHPDFLRKIAMAEQDVERLMVDAGRNSWRRDALRAAQLRLARLKQGDEVNTGTIKITAVERKEGTSASTGKPWTKFLIHAEGGMEYGTFDAALANTAFPAVGKHANITWEPGSVAGRNDLKTLVVDESVPADPEPVRDRTPHGEADWDLIGLRKTRCALWAALFNGPALTGMPLNAAITHGVALVRAAELDVFHRQPAQAEEDIPF